MAKTTKVGKLIPDRPGSPCSFLVGEGYNHFEISETFSDPYGLLGRVVLEQMGLVTA